MDIKNPNPLPRLVKEIKIQEKRMRTLNALENLSNYFQKELKKINISCPFGSESLEVQNAVNVAQHWSNEFDAFLLHTRNKIVMAHDHAVRVLSEDEGFLDPKEQAEDDFAAIKTHLMPELEASRVVREQDQLREKLFSQKLDSLKNEYLGKQPSSTLDLNKRSDHYSVVE